MHDDLLVTVDMLLKQLYFRWLIDEWVYYFGEEELERIVLNETECGTCNSEIWDFLDDAGKDTLKDVVRKLTSDFINTPPKKLWDEMK